ncbi:MAG: precorrin-8X methylmutase, partial [Rhodospirillaceae bacterium]|nr:precorrin-8X methylmutase [Rhodospirillaceae bacterium]
GAAESKDALIERATEWGVPFITLTGRMGGSALAAACVNALAGDS